MPPCIRAVKSVSARAQGRTDDLDTSGVRNGFNTRGARCKPHLSERKKLARSSRNQVRLEDPFTHACRCTHERGLCQVRGTEFASNGLLRRGRALAWTGERCCASPAFGKCTLSLGASSGLKCANPFDEFVSSLVNGSFSCCQGPINDSHNALGTRLR